MFDSLDGPPVHPLVVHAVLATPGCRVQVHRVTESGARAARGGVLSPVVPLAP